MKITNKKIAVLAENLYQELEVWYPILRFREAGGKVMVVGSGSSDTYKSKLGYPVKVDLKAENVKIDEIDALIIPGGYAPDIMRTYPAMVDLVRKTSEAGKVVAAICHGGWMLASANIVSGKKVTCYRAIKDDLIHAGGEYHDESVICDGKLITSRIPDDLPGFCEAILNALQN